MHRFVSPLIRLVDRLSPPRGVSAHCAIPCGIYDPHTAQSAPLTVVRMNQLIANLAPPAFDAPAEERRAGINSLTRYVKTKEDHAELCKKEIDILWHDYFRPGHLEKTL